MDPVSLSDSYRRDGLIRSFDVLNDDEVQSIKLRKHDLGFVIENAHTIVSPVCIRNVQTNW